MRSSRIGSLLMAGVGVAHFVPATAVVSRRRVEDLYDVDATDRNVELLLRHRATFFGLVGAALLAGAVHPPYRLPALLAGVLSLGSFVGLTEAAGPANEELTHIVRVDVGLLGALAGAAALTR